MPNFELGKYAVYILPAYAITIVVITAMIAETLIRTARWKREVEKREALRDDKKKA
jgi:heme exporter protein D